MLASQPLEKNISGPENSSSSLPKNQRAAVIFLSFLGIAVIVFWAWQFKSRISSPFKGSDRQAALAVVASSSNLLKDTDGDGLPDSEELNFYHTSPYLADSDSDGISDGQEIKQGTDPNCPAGQTCGLETVQPPAQTATSTFPGVSSTSPTSITLEEKLVSGDVTPTELRQVLIDNGADKSALDQVSDVDLIRAYQEMLQTKLNGTSTPSQSTTSPN